jgi:hypothetical protein
MTLRTLTLGYVLCSGLGLLTPASGLAQTATPQSFQRDSQRLRAELERVNGDIAALKSSGRSVRNDFLLRDKLAEAEALARKLTEAEAQERTRHAPAPAAIPGSALIPPVGTPHDSAVELEAKADLLSDQARRFRAEADALAHTAEQIRARQALRRRAGAWDRDPLAGFENSKRSFAVSGRASATDSGSGTRGSTQGNNGTGSLGAKGTASDNSSTTYGGGATTPVPPPSVALGPGSTTTEASGPAVATMPTHSTPVTAPVVSDSASKAVQQRPLLDPASLASVRSNLTQSGSLSDPEAVEAAALALRKHAQALEERARRLRTGVAQD